MWGSVAADCHWNYCLLSVNFVLLVARASPYSRKVNGYFLTRGPAISPVLLRYPSELDFGRSISDIQLPRHSSPPPGVTQLAPVPAVAPDASELLIRQFCRCRCGWRSTPGRARRAPVPQTGAADRRRGGAPR